MKVLLSSVLCGCLLLSGCSLAPRHETAAGRVHHVVLCWLKEPGNREHRRRIIEVTRTFAGMEDVIEVQVGKVLASERGLVDDSFDVGIHLTFASVEAMNRYLVDPVHISAVKDVIRPLTGRIVAYDFVE